MKQIATFGVLVFSSVFYVSAGAVNVDYSYKFRGEDGKSIIKKIDGDASRFRNPMVLANNGVIKNNWISVKKTEIGNLVQSLGDWAVANGETGARNSARQDGALDHILDAPSLREHAGSLLGDQRGDTFATYEHLKPQTPIRCKTKYVAPVPEPEIYAMLIAGAGMVGFMSRRRRKAVS